MEDRQSVRPDCYVVDFILPCFLAAYKVRKLQHLAAVRCWGLGVVQLSATCIFLLTRGRC